MLAAFTLKLGRLLRPSRGSHQDVYFRPIDVIEETMLCVLPRDELFLAEA